MDNWDEIRTAFQVARLGTVSGAAEVLGVHHATVIRHIDALESRLGAKLFQRHARGYTATEAGQDLLAVAGQADDQFAQLANRIKGRGDEVTGDLILTTVAVLGAPLVPVIGRFQDQHPDVKVRLYTDERLFRLEYGEAHVAIRAGKLPDQPDNVVQPFFRSNVRLKASPAYVERYGMLDAESLPRHRFIGHTDQTPRAPHLRWIAETVPEEAIVFRASDLYSARYAVCAGMGIGFIADWDRDGTADLVEMLPQMEEWSAPIWLVTHMDLHRTVKVQTFLRHLKEAAADWPKV